MMVLVGLEEVKQFCRIDGHHEDDTLVMLIEAATEAALAIADGWDGVGPVPARLRLAALNHIANAYGNREDGADVPPSAARLLMPFRTLDV